MPVHQLNRPSGIAVCFWMAAALFVYAVMILITLDRLQEMSGGVPVFDMMPTGYDAQYANSLLGSLGEKGRHYYLWRQIPLDLIYPALFGIAFYHLANWLADKLGAFQRILRLIAVFALLSAFSDYIENIFIIQMLRHYPDLSDVLVNAANLATILKAGQQTVYFLGIVAVLLASVIRFTLNLRSTKTG